MRFSRLAMAGEAALLKSGMFFCKRMIREAITVFKGVIEGTFDVDEFIDSEDEDDEDISENEESEEIEDCDLE